MLRLVPATLLFAWFCYAAPQDRDTLLIVPHTHWEGAVFKTREEYLEIGLPHILEALHLMRRYPDYRFVLDQMCYIKPFLDRYPTEAATFREMLTRGQLEIAGGTVTMHDNNVPSGESIARQYLIGKWFFRDRLGYDVKTGWGLDTFGHNAQMPQILKLAGMDSYWFQRGVPGAHTPAEFLWQGIDGTRMPAFWLPIGYGALYDTPRDLDGFAQMVRSRFDALAPFARGYGRVLLAGADVSEPEPQLPRLLAQLQRPESLPFNARLGLPSEYAALIAQHRPEREVIAGDMNPVFQGVYSTRIEVKQWMRELERTLTSAEKAGVLAGRLADADREATEHVWEPVLFNQAHDLSSGVMMDKVYDDAISTYGGAKRQGDEILNARLDEVAGRINTEGEGVPLVVFNLLGWERSDLAEAEVGFSAPGVHGFALLDAAGKAVPYQIEDSRHGDDGGIQFARIAFIARGVPSMGYAVYRVAPNSIATAAGPTALAASGGSSRDDTGSIENEFYRATFNLWTGAMTGLTLKPEGWEVLKAPGNVVAREEDGGDFWELYGTLNGGRFTAMTRKDLGPKAETTRFSTDNVGGSGSVGGGPVFVQFSISHPFGKNQFATRVRLYAGIPRIDIHTQVLNQEQFVRYRVLFPTSLEHGHNVQEIAFGSIERPAQQEFPAQNWMDYSAGGHGLALLNRGLPGNTAADGTLLLSLMRSTHLISYGAGGGFEPGTSSDSGLEVGKWMSFDYALLPHTGAWQDAQVFRAGLEFNNPLIVRKTGVHGGDLPPAWSFMEVSHPHVVVSALKPSRHGEVAVRVYEAAGQPAPDVRLHFARAVTAAREANLIEDPGGPLPVRGNAVSFGLRPYEIKTICVRLAPAASRPD
jgi:alpha-mannosidase